MNIVGFKVNDGHPAFGEYAGQNSEVVSVCVEFDQDADLDPGALTLSLHINGVSFNGQSCPNGKGCVPTCDPVCYGLAPYNWRKWYLVFQGPQPSTCEPAHTAKLSLIDGVYKLHVDGSKVHPKGGSGNGPSGDFVFHRLFGKVYPPDQSGNNFTARVTSIDNLQMQSALANPANYQAALDGNGDGTIDSVDDAKFTANFNKPLCWTV